MTPVLRSNKCHLKSYGLNLSPFAVLIPIYERIHAEVHTQMVEMLCNTCLRHFVRMINTVGAVKAAISDGKHLIRNGQLMCEFVTLSP